MTPVPDPSHGETNPDPLRAPARRGVSSVPVAASALLPLVVYLLTLARDVTVTDSGELAAVAATLGIAHPPGYPLFTLLGWALANLAPVGTVAFRVGLLSAVAAALTIPLLHRTGLLLAPSADAGARPHDGLTAGFAALGGALLYAFARTPWSQAVVVEVYALQTLLVALFLLACAASLRTQADPSRTVPAAALAVGLSLANHLTGVLLVPGLAATAILAPRPTGVRLRTVVGRAFLALLLPLLLYAYLPIRSRALPAVCWNPIDSVQAFLVHVTARQYQGLWGSQGLRLPELERFLTRQLPFDGTPLLPVLAAVGLVVLARHRSRFALVSGLTLVLMVGYNLGYPIPDVDLYYIPVLAIVGLWAVVGTVTVTRAAARWRRAAGTAMAAAICLASVVPLGLHWRDNDRRDFRLIACAVRDTLAPLPGGAVLFTGRWATLSSPALYAQHVDGLRPDVLVLDYHQLASPALGARLERDAPELARACAEELEAVRRTGLNAERGQAYDATAGGRELARLRRTLLEAAAAARPTSVTSDLYTDPMVARYRLIPEGLVARVETRDVLRPFPVDAIAGPCGRREELRGREERLVWDDYRVAFLNRAQALHRHGLEAEAEVFARRAAELQE